MSESNSKKGVRETKLILQPTIADMTREQLESHVDVVRARRMVAALEYQAGVQADLEYMELKLRKQIKGQYESLGRELQTLDRALEKVEARMDKIEELKTQLGFEVDYG